MVQELEMDRAIDGLTSASTQGMPPLRVGLLGLGNVGGGTYRVLQRNAALIAARAGRRIAIDKVAVRDVAKARQCVGHGVAVTDDPFELVRDPELDVIVESIGGTTVARDLVMAAIAHGKHVVTANKALLALHGDEVFATAKVQGVIVNYEGAVAVSIPIIKALREAYSANRIDWVAGIVNGTSNFILSEMESGGQGFQAALQDAQRQGFAEQDPTFDVDGIDAAHKLTLLASNAFGIPLSFHRIHVQGIRGIQVRDMECAGRLGYRIKLLAVARRVGEGIDMWVKPVLLPADRLLAQVDGSMNAVMVCADAAGTSMHYGAGAGAEQTASAVIADLVDIARWSGVAREQRIPSLAFNGIAVRAHPVNVTQEVSCGHYVRIDLREGVERLPGLKALAVQTGVQVQDHQWVPRGRSSAASLALISQPCTPAAANLLAQLLETLPGAQGIAQVLRVESLDTAVLTQGAY